MNSSMQAPLRYRIQPKSPAAHLFEVSVTVTEPDPAGQRFMLPVWIPGSYMIREFARHIVVIRAECDGKPATCTKIDKATWACEAGSYATLTVTCEIYAWDLSVRAAHLDESHAFFNGTSVFLLPVGKESAPCELEIAPPDGESDDKRYANWRIATSLREHRDASKLRHSGEGRNPVQPNFQETATDWVPASAGTTGLLEVPITKVPAPARLAGRKSTETPVSAGVSTAGPKAFGRFYATSYEELIDHPVEMGTFTHASFEACGVRHHIAITGRHRADMGRLCADLKKICEAQIQFFEPETAAAPMGEYWFLVMAVGDGYGGLEHRASTALICNRDDLPLAGDAKVTNGYRRFLGLASHEYFHTWNVKRIKPDVFIEYDLTRENYTRQLWFFEGITSYYDDLFLARTKLIEPLAYLEMIAENIGRVGSQFGRLKQSVADASFDAWVKYYRQDENSPNAIVSYYQKGAMIGLALDLTIRQRTDGAKTLDDVMRALWVEYGKREKGVPEGGVQAVAEKIAGIPLAEFFAHAVDGTSDLDFVPLFESIGIDLAWKIPGQSRPEDVAPVTLGAKIGNDANGDAKLLQVFDGGAAQLAGLSAGDAIIALDGLRVSGTTLDRRLRTYATGARVELTAFRRDELMTFQVTLQALPAQTCSLTMRDMPIDAKARRNAWLLG